MLHVSRLLANGGVKNLCDKFKVKIKNYTEHDLMVLNYESFERDRDHPVVVECRGLILNSRTYAVVSRSFDRFFNFQELLQNIGGEDAHHKLFQSKENFKFYEKIDGSLIKIYKYNGEWHASTRGSAFAENLCVSDVTFKRLVLQAIQLDEAHNQFQALCNEYLDCASTHMFELTSKHNRIVTVYDEQPTLWYLASRNNETGDYFYCSNLPFCKYPKCYEFTSVQECVEHAAQLKNLEEGFVVYDKNNAPLCKIKSDVYLNMHKNQSRAENPTKLAQLVINGEHDDFLALFPHLKSVIKPYVDARNTFTNESTINIMVSGLTLNQQRFNELVQTLPWKCLAYRCRKAQTIDVESEFLKLTEPEKIKMIKNIIKFVSTKQALNNKLAPTIKLPSSKQLLVLIGISGSGKSTYAKSLKGYTEINRDDVRVKLFLNGDYTKLNAFYNQSRKCRQTKEEQITKMCIEQFLKAAKCGANVVVSDTNLNTQSVDMWQKMAATHNYHFLTRLMDVSLETALERNYKRSDKFPLNPETIKKQYKKFLKVNNFEYYVPVGDKFPRAVLCDLDGTVALPTNRSFYDFDNRVAQDEARLDVITCVKYLANCHDAIIVFMSGRSVICEQPTRNWIEKYFDIKSYKLFMRLSDDTCKDYLLKLKLFNDYIRGKYNVIAVFDDRPCVVRMWQDLKIPTVFNVCRDYLEF
uniref:Polynucleotide kinase/polynucleotide ligase n=1 Tax=Autographa californica multiple nucleopolyhedrovirus TaxID=307456 RepID=H2E105_9ABAC|nr:polynucleotide kinase/polynucleotide ligase [Autographa californica multiple nucleopolyhedrovirus]AEY76192.1 polynucleotide kinase/polynucleotide ligase [Autographa californica multiple nucleopolyhedrovirus]AEY76202.1 polynucleotide kinase/polynucleotide ligase [Autographa californica multiple nucleopolyhedrovirus]